MIPVANVTTAVNFFAARVGTQYDFGGMFAPGDPSIGTDCSGECDTILRILTTGNGGPVDAGGSFIRTVDTESWPYNYPADLAVAVGTVGPYGTVCAGDAQPGPAPTVYPPQIPADAAAVIYLMHAGGGVNSHMMIVAEGVVMETGGDHNDTGGDGQYASPNGPATSTIDPEWTDVWYLPGPISGAPPPPPPPPPVLTPQQQNALTIINIGAAMGISVIGQQMGLACPLDESGMRMLANPNVPESMNYAHEGIGTDHNSCGPFQQQFDQGWGTVACEMDWACSAGLFFTALARTDYNNPANSPGWRIQQVQGSGDPTGSNYDAQWNNAVALYNSVINAPPPGGFLMALTDTQQQQLFSAICGPVASQSPFRQLGEGAVWDEAQIVMNDDSFEHPQYVEWAALRGDPISLAILQEVAGADVTQYPDRIEDIRLAQQVLVRITTAGGVPAGPVQPVSPTPSPSPIPTPAPTPTPTPAAAPVTPGVTITTANLVQWGKDAITILGALGTWATAAHGILGQFLGGASATVVPVSLAAVTAISASHTVHQNRVAQKQLTKLKGTP
jgi:hypothetical protein